MSMTTIPVETENLLLYLLVTNLRSARTIDALSNLCPGDAQIDEVLNWLINAGHVYADEDTYELTFSGLHIARQIQTQVQGERLGIVNTMHINAKPETKAGIPTLETHPLRAGAEHPHHPDAEAHETLRYVLASETPRNILPIPVLNGDVLGRETDVDISLPYDEYLSSEHCRFTVGEEAGRTILYIEDLGSRNGTHINGFHLEAGRLFGLEHGDRVHVGSTILIVVKIPA